MVAGPTGPTSLDLAGVADGTQIDAVDVLVPMAEAETAIDEARTTSRVSSTDTTEDYLENKISGTNGLTTQVSGSGGDETLQVIPDTTGASQGDVLTVTDGAGSVGFQAQAGLPTGTMLPYFGLPTTLPSGYLLADGSGINMLTYKDLLDVFITSTDYYSTDIETTFGLDTGNTVTADVATDKLLLTSQPYSNGDVVVFTTDNTLPDPLEVNTAYYVVEASTNDFKVSLTSGGSAVDLADTGTGIHTVHSEFILPDMRGRGFVGLDAMVSGSPANVVTDASADAVGGTYGEETHQLTEAELASHRHQVNSSTGTSTGGSVLSSNNFNSATTTYTENTGGDTPHNNIQPSLFGNWIIKS